MLELEAGMLIVGTAWSSRLLIKDSAGSCIDRIKPDRAITQTAFFTNTPRLSVRLIFTDCYYLRSL